MSLTVCAHHSLYLNLHFSILLFYYLFFFYVFFFCIYFFYIIINLSTCGLDNLIINWISGSLIFGTIMYLKPVKS